VQSFSGTALHEREGHNKSISTDGASLSFSPFSNLHDHDMPTPTDHELPSYEMQQSPVRGPEYQRSLERGNNQKWLTLFVRSGAKDAASMPMFFENDDISGRVEIGLDKAESVKSVTITVSFDLQLCQTKF
jgi:NAD-dependent oxidoreductase involved in siderophore biosynthesis